MNTEQVSCVCRLCGRSTGSGRSVPAQAQQTSNWLVLHGRRESRLICVAQR